MSDFDIMKRKKFDDMINKKLLTLMLISAIYTTSTISIEHDLYNDEDSYLLQKELSLEVPSNFETSEVNINPDLNQEIRELTGRIELMEFDIKQIKSMLENIHNELTKTTVESKNSINFEDSNQLTDTTPLHPVLTTIEDAYDHALATLKEDKLEEAEKEFFDIIHNYPSHEIKSNAYFWYAETFFRRANFEKAARFYLKGYKQYPKGNKASDSLLKLALALGEINKNHEACTILKKLDKEFPDRSAIAKKRSEDAKTKFNCEK